MHSSLAIIGTAGRKEDQSRLTHFHYNRMVSACIKLIEHLQFDLPDLRLISGGAAWADHLVVTLTKRGVVPYENTTLYTPSSLTSEGYVGENEFSKKTANTANYYHRLFSNCVGIDSIKELLELKYNGSILLPGNGSFHARNSDVAKSVSPNGVLLAFTFGAPDIQQSIWTIRKFSGNITATEAGLKDGGTADTWCKASCTKYHCVLGPTSEDSNFI